jgi:lipopolysaccharide exporter
MKLFKFKREGFTGDILTLVTGTSFAQIIAVGSAPLITRIYSPESYGIANAFASIVSLLCVFSGLKYDQAIIIAKDNEDAKKIFTLSFLINVAFTLLLIPVAYFGGSYLLKLVKMDNIFSFLWMIPVAVLFQSLYTTLNAWSIRGKKFANLSFARISNQLSNSAATIGLGIYVSPIGESIIKSNIIAAIASIFALLGRNILAIPKIIFDNIFNVKGLVFVLKRYKKFPLYTTGSAIINEASWQLPILMFGGFFTPTIVGFYALGFKIIQMPMSLVAGAVSQVFLQRASSMREISEIQQLVDGLFKRLLMVTFLPCLILSIVGFDLFMLVFGEQWAEAGIYSQILAPWAMVWFISSPLSSLYYVFEKQKEEFGIQILILVTRFVSIVIGVFFHEPRLAVALFAIAGMFTYGYLIKILFSFATINIYQTFKKCKSIITDSLVLAVVVLVFKLIGVHSILLLVISLFVLSIYFFKRRHEFNF